jgi:uncharacterized membrane protein YuzA (DUF378 family)
MNKSLTEAMTIPTVQHMDKLSTEGGHMKPTDVVAAALVIVGGLNWGLVAIAEFDLVAWLVGEEFGTTNALSRIVYGLVGLAAVYSIGSLFARRQPADAHRVASASR